MRRHFKVTCLIDCFKKVSIGALRSICGFLYNEGLNCFSAQTNNLSSQSNQNRFLWKTLTCLVCTFILAAKRLLDNSLSLLPYFSYLHTIHYKYTAVIANAC